MKIACGIEHTAILTGKYSLSKCIIVQGNLYSLGSNSYGQLGIGKKSLPLSCTLLLLDSLFDQ